jgi:hypothetical protein
MRETVLTGSGKQITELPREEWERNLSQVPGRFQDILSFMSEEHHLVRNFVVRELPRVDAPIPPEQIAEALNLTLPRTNAILNELERHLFFLVRNPAGAVQWAFPVTAADTDHHLTFNTGERLDAA